jgi:hypothetical protein
VSGKEHGFMVGLHRGWLLPCDIGVSGSCLEGSVVRGRLGNQHVI